MRDWNFPKSNGLGTQGISHGGIEAFKGKIMESLTREICQNSLDACNGEKPVKIKFKQINIDKSLFPGYEKLNKYMNDARKYWKERDNKKSVEFFENACNVLSSNNIPVLQISDYNTTGLTGNDDPNKNSPWFSMVSSEGVSNKSGSDSGSFGIGKSSIYAVSTLRTVFFNTYDKDGKFAAEGVSKLASFKEGGKDIYGIGYYGETNIDGETNCVESIDELDDFAYRDQYGTDIFVMGFYNYSNWKESIIISLLDNFLLAIYNSELEVEIQDEIVNADTLKVLLEKHKEDCPSAHNYYRVLESKEEIIENDNLFPNIKGKIKLKVLIFKDELANRTVLISRSNGMKLFDKKSISSSIQFSAILTMEGDEINQYFAKMEDPTHSKWEPDRYDQENKIKEANKVLKTLYGWVKETIVKKGTENYGEEVEIKGMEGLLPEFYELKSSKNKHESLENHSSKITVNKKKKDDKPSTNLRTDGAGSSYYEYEDTGTLDENGEYETKDVPHKKESEVKGGDGGPANGTEGVGNRPITKFAEVSNYKKRIYISNARESVYTIKMTVNQNIEDCRLQIFVSGETTNIDANVVDANSDGKDLMISQNVIHVGRVYKNFPKTIKFKIDSDYQCNLEVKLYANKK